MKKTVMPLFSTDDEPQFRPAFSLNIITTIQRILWPPKFLVFVVPTFQLVHFLDSLRCNSLKNSSNVNDCSQQYHYY